MFNFFDEIKKSLPLGEQELGEYNLVNISGKILYVEGHKGLVSLSLDKIAFKLKKSVMEVEGENLSLQELTDCTLKIVGKIKKITEN